MKTESIITAEKLKMWLEKLGITKVDLDLLRVNLSIIKNERLTMRSQSCLKSNSESTLFLRIFDAELFDGRKEKRVRVSIIKN